MMTNSSDPVRAAALWLFSGPTNSDADFERYLVTIRDQDERVAGRESVALVVVEPENPPPDARWRRRIANATMEMKSNPLVVFVMPSLPLRAVVTAVNWLRPPPFQLSVHATVREAFAFLGERRPDIPEKTYRELLADARMAATASRSSAPLSSRRPAK